MQIFSAKPIKACLLFFVFFCSNGKSVDIESKKREFSPSYSNESKSKLQYGQSNHSERVRINPCFQVKSIFLTSDL